MFPKKKGFNQDFYIAIQVYIHTVKNTHSWVWTYTSALFTVYNEGKNKITNTLK